MPDVPAHVHAYSSLLDRVMRELKRVQFCLKFGPSRYNQRHWTASHDFSEILGVVCLDKMGSNLRRDPASQTKIARITPLQLLPNRCHGENWNTVFLPLVHELAEIGQGLMLVRRPDKDRKSHRRHIQPDGVMDRCCNRLVSQRLSNDAGST